MLYRLLSFVLLFGLLTLAACGGEEPGPVLDDDAQTDNTNPNKNLSQNPDKDSQKNPAPRPEIPQDDKPEPEKPKSLLREYVPPADLTDDPANPWPSEYVGDPLKDGCRLAKEMRDGELIASTSFHYIGTQLKHRRKQEAGSKIYFQYDYEYNEAGQLSRVLSLHSGIPSYEHITDYDEQGRISQVTWNEWQLHGMGGDKADRRLDEFYHHKYKYIENEEQLYGMQQFFGRYPGLTSIYEYNDQGQVLRIQKSFLRIIGDPDTGQQKQITVITEEASYTYNNTGHVLSILLDRPITDEYGNETGRSFLQETTFQYQDSQLQTEKIRAPQEVDSYELTYEYDEQGRRIRQTRRNTKNLHNEWLVTYQY